MTKLRLLIVSFMLLVSASALADGSVFGRIKMVEPSTDAVWWKQAYLKPSLPAAMGPQYAVLYFIPKTESPQAAPERASLILRNFQFEPRAVLVKPEGIVQFTNRTPYALTVRVGSSELKLTPQGGKAEWTAEAEGPISVQVQEYAHMQAGILVQTYGTMVVTDGLGTVPLTDLNPDSYDVRIYSGVWVKAPALSVRDGGILGLEYKVELGAGAPLAVVEAPPMPVPPRPVRPIPSVSPVAPPNPILPPTPPAPPPPPEPATPPPAPKAETPPAPKPEPTPAPPEENDDFFQIQ